jgi:RHS repeat-associated protein
VTIVETTSGSETSTKQFVWAGMQRQEARDGSGNITSQYFAFGQLSSSSNYFYELNHRGDVVGVTNNTGGQVAAISYDAYGRPTILSGSFVPDFGFTGLYWHQRSGLNLAVYRAYNPSLGRWINRDPIGQRGGINLYGYGANRPTSLRDLSGLVAILSNPISGEEPPEEPLLPSPPNTGGGVVGGGGQDPPPPPGYGPPSKLDWSTWESPEMWDLKYKFWCAFYAAAVGKRTYDGAIAAGAPPEVAAVLAGAAAIIAYNDCIDKPYRCPKLPPPPKSDDDNESGGSPPQLPGPQK